MQFSQDLDVETKKRIDGGRRLSAILNQNKNAPIPFERQVVVMYAATNGFFDVFPPEKMGEVEERFLAYMDREGKNLLDAIRTEKAISDDTEVKLKAALQSFVTTAG